MYDMLSDLPTSDDDANTDSLRSESEAGDDDDANGRGAGESDGEAFGLGEEDKDGFTPFEMPKGSRNPVLRGLPSSSMRLGGSRLADSERTARAYDLSARLDSEAESERLLTDDLSNMTDSGQTARPFHSSAMFTEDLSKSMSSSVHKEGPGDKQISSSISEKISSFFSDYFDISFDLGQVQTRRRIGVVVCFIGFILAAVSTVNMSTLLKTSQVSVHDMSGVMSHDISSTATVSSSILSSSSKASLKIPTASSSLISAKPEKPSPSKKVAINAQPSNIGMTPPKPKKQASASVQSAKITNSSESQPKERFLISLDTGRAVPYTKDHTRKNSGHLGPYVRLSSKQEKFIVRFTDTPSYGFTVSPLSPISQGSIIVIVSKADQIIQRGHQSRKDTNVTWTPSHLPEDQIEGYINVTVIIPSAQQFQSTEIDLGSAWLHMWRWTKALSPYTDPLKEHVTEGISYRMAQAKHSANAVTSRCELTKVMNEIERTGREIWGSAIMSLSDTAAKAVSKYRVGVEQCVDQTYRSARRPILRTLAKAQARSKILKKKVMNKRLLKKRTAAGNMKKAKEVKGKRGLFL
jgi:hypothetical protein